MAVAEPRLTDYIIGTMKLTRREGDYDATPHLRRMMLRTLRANPLGVLRFVAKSIRLELAARRRRREAG